jgi:mannitol/fructose-specific phosphotransferase system IIA component (Ntr-type)
MPPPVLNLIPFLHPHRVLDLTGSPGRQSAVGMVAEAASEGFPREVHDAFVIAVLQREEVGTTAVGGGAAIPHARMHGLDCCRIAIGRCPAGIDFAAADRKPVRLLTLLATRDSDRLEHLRLLATLAAMLHRPGFVDSVLAAPSPEAVVAIYAQG